MVRDIQNKCGGAYEGLNGVNKVGVLFNGVNIHTFQKHPQVPEVFLLRRVQGVG